MFDEEAKKDEVNMTDSNVDIIPSDTEKREDLKEFQKEKLASDEVNTNEVHEDCGKDGGDQCSQQDENDLLAISRRQQEILADGMVELQKTNNRLKDEVENLKQDLEKAKKKFEEF